MARITAFKLTANEMWMVTLEGTKQAPQIATKERVTFPSEQTPGQFTNWAETQFELILNRESPDLVTYKLTAGLKRHNQIFKIYFGLAIINLVCERKGISIKHTSPQALRPTAFGLPRNGNIDAHINNLFSPGPPWNVSIREAAAMALLEL